MGLAVGGLDDLKGQLQLGQRAGEGQRPQGRHPPGGSLHPVVQRGQPPVEVRQRRGPRAKPPLQPPSGDAAAGPETARRRDGLAMAGLQAYGGVRAGGWLAWGESGTSEYPF